jgi:plastocyanin
MRRTLAAALTAAALLTALPATAATQSIRLVDNKVRPAKVRVARGTTVRFVWAGHNLHNVYVFSGPQSFHSGTKAKGTYRRRLTRKGTYQLGCTLHAGMTLTIRVL